MNKKIVICNKHFRPMKKVLISVILCAFAHPGLEAQNITGMYANLGNGYMFNSSQPDFYKNSIGKSFSFGLFNRFSIKGAQSRLNYDFSLCNFHYQNDTVSAVALQNLLGVDFLINPFSKGSNDQVNLFIGVGIYGLFQTRSFEPESGIETINDGYAGYVGLGFKVNYVIPIQDTEKSESAFTLGFAFRPKTLLLSKDEIPTFTTASFTLGFEFGRKR